LIADGATGRKMKNDRSQGLGQQFSNLRFALTFLGQFA